MKTNARAQKHHLQNMLCPWPCRRSSDHHRRPCFASSSRLSQETLDSAKKRRNVSLIGEEAKMSEYDGDVGVVLLQLCGGGYGFSLKKWIQDPYLVKNGYRTTRFPLKSAFFYFFIFLYFINCTYVLVYFILLNRDRENRLPQAQRLLTPLF